MLVTVLRIACRLCSRVTKWLGTGVTAANVVRSVEILMCIFNRLHRSCSQMGCEVQEKVNCQG